MVEGSWELREVIRDGVCLSRVVQDSQRLMEEGFGLFYRVCMDIIVM